MTRKRLDQKFELAEHVIVHDSSWRVGQGWYHIGDKHMRAAHLWREDSRTDSFVNCDLRLGLRLNLWFFRGVETPQIQVLKKS
jgi:hypothetical protein